MKTDTPETDTVDAMKGEVHAAFFLMRSHAWKLERQRNELLTALKIAEDRLTYHAPLDAHIDTIRAAIAKVEGNEL